MSAERSDELKALLLNLRELPPLPLGLATIMQLMSDEDVSIKELERAILQEPAITAKVLSLANSAFYGYRRKIGTISQAIVVMGLTTVRNLVLGVYMVDGFRMPSGARSALDCEAFWLHCVATATVSGVIAERCGNMDRESAWIGGLLHDLGKMVLNFGLSDQYPAVVKQCLEAKRPLRELECESLGACHTEVGEWMSNRWQLPDDIATAVRYHHDPKLAPDNTPLVAAVHLADILVKQEQIGHAGDEVVPKLMPAALNALHIDVAGVKDLLRETRERKEAMREFHAMLV